MRILFVVPYVPNLIRVRPYNLIRYLNARGHQIDLVTVTTSTNDRADAIRMKDFCRDVKTFDQSRWRSVANCILTLPRQTPLQAVYCWHPKMAACLRESIVNTNQSDSPYDVIHVEHLRGVRYGLDLSRVASSVGIPVVWDSVDCISLLFSQTAQQSRRTINRWLTRFELARTRRYEGQAAGQFAQVFVTSPLDRAAFIDLLPARSKKTPITVLPNGVDLDYFTPDKTITRQPYSMVISGKMSYHANVTMVMDFVTRTLPLVWEKHSEVKLWVVGKDPTPEIRALASDSRITVTGTVPDIRPYLRKATLAVTPIAYGAGIQNKVLEAMACGTPVITTPKAVSAINIENGKEALVASSPEEFAQAIWTLMENPGLQAKISGNGLDYVTHHHRWTDIVDDLENCYRSHL